MPHNIIDKYNCLAAKAEQLKDYAVQIMGMTEEPPEGAGALLERIESLFTAICDGSPLLLGDTLDGLIGEAETMLGI